MTSSISGPGAGPGTSPTWYDVLGVDRTASAATIKQAWREATDKFEPGTGAGQFRMFNEAADVLLDPERRAAYDATLTGDTDSAPVPPAAEPTPTVRAEASEPTGPTSTRRGLRAPRRRTATGTAAPTAGRDGSRVPGFLARPARSTAVLAVLALLVVAVVTAAVLVGLRVQDAAVAQDARSEAPAAAERAAAAMLSYDYRTLPEDRQRASRYLTGGFKKQYLDNFTLLEKQADGTDGAAVQSKAVVEASVESSGVVDVSSSGRTVRVLVFVNQVSEKEGADPQIFQNRVQMTMQDVDGRWLVSNLRSY
ncbi:J domain-containing protein [Nocardioides aurantiacus]|uniref:Mce-associated membrane protein n=1 Tax=Nocardioides aurantiacus TaxID=86796 RepID=A0A3N2CPZ9_9ACTN|nr:J domain-containing protein [Nocardioides aurantiacus]ROR89591.1 Mce-associated membrane protein [Nocardioides aurantiacus]